MNTDIKTEDLLDKTFQNFDSQLDDDDNPKRKRFSLFQSLKDIIHEIKCIPSKIHDNQKKKIESTFITKYFEYRNELLSYPDPYSLNRKKYSHIRDLLVDDKELMAAVVVKDYEGLRFCSDRLRNDKEIVKAALERYYFTNGQIFNYAGDKLKKDKEFILDCLSIDPEIFCYADKELLNDEELAYQAIKIATEDYLTSSRHCHPETIFEKISESLKSNLDFGVKVMQFNGSNIKYLSPSLFSERDILFAAVSNWSFAFEFADNKLKDDKRLVKHAIKNDRFGVVLQYVSNRLLNDEEVVLLSINKDWESFRNIDSTLKDNTQFAIKALKANEKVVYYLSKRLRTIIDSTQADYPDESPIKILETVIMLENDNINYSETDNVVRIKELYDLNKYLNCELPSVKKRNRTAKLKI